MKMVLVALGCLLAVVAVAYIQRWFSGDVARPPVASAPDLLDHPIYSRYDFGRADNVIDVGYQPLGVPIGAVSQALMRDAVLKSALAEEGLEIRFHSFLKGADVNFFLKRGDLELALGEDRPARKDILEEHIPSVSCMETIVQHDLTFGQV